MNLAARHSSIPIAATIIGLDVGHWVQVLRTAPIPAKAYDTPANGPIQTANSLDDTTAELIRELL